MKTLKLSSATVEIIDVMTWGMQEQIRASMFAGLKVSGLGDKSANDIQFDPTVIIDAKCKAIELCVKKITLNDGTEINYSRDWLDNLCVEDGDLLLDAVENVTSVKKK